MTYEEAFDIIDEFPMVEEYVDAFYQSSLELGPLGFEVTDNEDILKNEYEEAEAILDKEETAWMHAQCLDPYETL